MSHRETKISRNATQRLRRPGVDRRPSHFRSDDVTMMAVENTRARLISQVVQQPGNNGQSEFSSYFYGPSRNTEPHYSVISHGASSTLKRGSIVPTYPIVGLRWNPYVTTSSVENSVTDFERPTQYSCRCDNCTSKGCPSRLSSSSTLKPSTFKANIMTFKDTFTMTPKLKDANCGCPSIPSTPRSSQVSIETSETITNDNNSNSLVRKCPLKYTPIPILKKQDDFIYKHHWCGRQKEKTKLPDVAERDTDVCDDLDANIKPKPVRSFFKMRRKEGSKEVIENQDNLRKVLYNEGISDTIANRYPISPIKVPSATNLNSLDKASKMSVSSKSVSRDKSYSSRDSTIPFAHRSDSKYHYTCKKSGSKHLFESDHDEFRHLVASPEIITRRYVRKPFKYQRVPSIKLPKRVLTSERDIELYVDNNKAKMQTLKAKKTY